MPSPRPQMDSSPVADTSSDDEGRQGRLSPVATVPAADRVPQFSLIQAIGTWMRSSFSRRSDNLKEALEEVLEEHEDESASALSGEERQMLENILAFGELEVSDVLIPRPDIVAVPHTSSLSELVAHIQEEGHTRMPVYREDLDDILGLIHIKDLIRFIGNEQGFVLSELIRPLAVVPPSMKVTDLLMRMRSSGIHMAQVVDEFGGTEGIVTLENLFERIVGDIHDEYDEEDITPDLQRLSDNVLLVNARMDIEALEAAIGLELADETEDFHTVGGLIFNLLGEIPRKGKKVEHHGVMFEVVEADARSIHRVRVKLPEKTDEGGNV